jgi:methyltransferase (TIGR00027 family)
VKVQKKRIETATSRTAEWTCLSRAVSSFETNSCYKSDDFIAPSILPGFVRLLTRIPLMRKFFPRVVPAKGMYEYVIARTKYIDSVFRQALVEGFEQIAILGAGFDTRALRFQHEAVKTRIFEFDVSITQNAKIGQYKRQGLNIPENVTLLSIDFEKESLFGKLEAAGFDREQRSLFIMEGVIMYLLPESVHGTFGTLCALAGKGSEIVFDHVLSSVLRNEGISDEERKIAHSVSRAGEQWRFSIEKNEVGHFLKTHDFKLVEHLDAHQLEQKYFKDRSGRIVGHVNGSHCLIRAAKM